MTAMLDQMRCSACGWLLAKVHLESGSVVEVKCTRCKELNLIRAANLTPAVNRA